MIRIIPAMSPTDSMNETEIKEFLRNSKIPLKLATIDDYGDPIIHPLWYSYENDRLYLITASNSRKLKNATKRTKIYFCIDTETRPYKGVKGKGTLTRITDPKRAVSMGEKIVTKYVGNVDNSLGKFLLGRLREGKETIMEITPRYYSVWDDSKSP